MLKDLARVLKVIILYSEHELLEVMLSDNFYIPIFGILEYDEEMYKSVKITHRQFFRERAKFLQVSEIKEERILTLIHFNFRLQYLKDCALAHFLDDRATNMM